MQHAVSSHHLLVDSLYTRAVHHSSCAIGETAIQFLISVGGRPGCMYVVCMHNTHVCVCIKYLYMCVFMHV